MKKGAYGREQKEVLRLTSEAERERRLQQVEEERRRQRKLSRNLRQTSPTKDATKERKITKILEMRASYYEAELLRELQIRKADVEAAEPALVIYKEFQPVGRPARTENGYFGVSPRPKARKPQSEAYSSAPSQKHSHRGQSKSFSSPMAPVDEDVLDHSIAKAQEHADAAESRRQRILEKAIRDLDQKLARFAHRRTFSVTPKLAKRV